jgi:cysteinyl-tRNA synthetase
MTDLHLYNSATRRKERFEPLDPNHVRMYVCGPTVYDLAHLGNARPVVVFDVLARLLRRLYPRVTYVRNITDVDDKILNRSRESGESIASVTARTTADFHRDMAALGNLPPDSEPRATGHIAEMIALIKKLIANGHAYEAERHVLFSVPSYAAYGKLSNRDPEEMLAGARIDVAPYKRSESDFVLWKPSDGDMPGWDSPWGYGRPGWHIECSAMAWRHLGEEFDIHGGGNDLIFPHHENELAQSVCAFPGTHFARVWMHNGMLLVDGQKMSKSLGNFFTLQDVLSRGPWVGEAFRLLLLKTHYRAPLDFSFAGLDEARRELDRFYRALERAGEPGPIACLPQAIVGALADDLNTPLALSALHRYADDALAGDVAGGAALRTGADVLGVLPQRAADWFRGGDDNVADIEAAIEARLTARKARNFAEADRIRDELKAKGIVLEDSASGTTWRRAS